MFDIANPIEIFDTTNENKYNLMYKHLEHNLNTWNKRAEIHIDSKMYDVNALIKGKCALKEIELSLLPDVTGKSLLHLQCHIGTDTISWARRGAKVTGIDFSSNSIAHAKDLAEKSGVSANFIQSEVTVYSMFTQPIHDIVFVSYGALCWLPDVKKWAKTVSRSLKKGGHLCLVEFHPILDIFQGYSYFPEPDPVIEENGTYTENCKGEKTTVITWAHPTSEVIDAIISAGMKIDSFKEYPFSPYDCFDDLEEREEGRFYYSKTKAPIPLVYSIMATKL